MGQPVDLNRLRETILRNQETGNPLPARTEEKIYATPDGRIVIGDAVRPDEERQLSEVHQATFAAAAGARAGRERQIVAEKFPPNTAAYEVDGVKGWYYTINDEFGNRYEMFAFHDGSMYQVQVVFPEVEDKYSPHFGHLFSDGCICFGEEGGLPNLEHVYANSVVWANGFTVFQQTGVFPFSVGEPASE